MTSQTTPSAEAAKKAFARILADLDFHQRIISRQRGRFRIYPLRTSWYVIQNIFWKVCVRLGHGPLIWATTFWGDRMRVVFPAYRSVYHFGILDGWELIVQKTLLDRLREGAVFFDVGANVGFYTLLGATLVGASGSVHAFEPTPSTFALLKENVKGKKNIQLNPFALGATEGEAELADFGILHSGLNSLERLQQGSLKTQKVRVPVHTLDAYCLEHNVRPTLMKIDVEGMEEDVLKGALRTLHDAKPILILEVAAYAESKALFDLLAQNGYDAYRATETLELMPYQIDSTHGRMNIVCVPHTI